MSAIAWLRADPRRLDLAIAAVTALVGTLLVLGAPDEFDAGWPEVAAGVGVFVLVALRRWQPFVLLAVAMVWTTAHVLIWDRPTPMVFAVLVLLTTACIRLDRKPAIGLGVVIAAWLYTLGLVNNDTQFRRVVDQLAEVGFEMLIYSFGSDFVIETDTLEHARAQVHDVLEQIRKKMTDA